MKKTRILFLFFVVAGLTGLAFAKTDWDGINKNIVNLSSQKKLSEAVKVGEEALLAASDDRKKVLPPESSTVMINLGILYKRSGDLERAERHLKNAMVIREKSYSVNDPLLAKICSSLGAIYNEQGKFHEAEYCYERALKLKESLKGENHVEVASVLDSLSGVYQSLENFPKAVELLKRALKIRIEAYGEEDLRTGVLYFNLGELYMAQEKKSDAESNYLRALAAFEASGENNPKTVYPLNQLALIYQDKGKFTEAESFYRRALKIRQAIYGDSHIEVANSLNNLAAVYLMQKKPQAEKLLLKALKICEDYHGSPVSLKRVLDNLIQYYQETHQAEKVSKYQKKLKKII